MSRVIISFVAATLLLVGLAPAAAGAVPPGTVVGVVSLGVAGHPADSGEVRVTAEFYDTGEAVAGAEALTESDGSYTLSGLPTDRLNLVFSYLGTGDYVALNRPYSALFAGTTFNTTIPTGYRLAGHVDIDDPGNPAAEGQVRVTAPGVRAEALTDENGDYDLGVLRASYTTLEFEVLDDPSYPVWYFDGSPTGTWRLVQPCCSPAYPPGYTPIANRVDLDVVVGAGPSIEGDLQLSDGTPAVGVGVRAVAYYGGGSIVLDTDADATGHFAFRAIPETTASYIIVWGPYNDQPGFAGGYWGDEVGNGAYLFVTPTADVTGLHGTAYRSADVAVTADMAALPGSDQLVVLTSELNEVTGAWSEWSQVSAVDPGATIDVGDWGPGTYRFALRANALPENPHAPVGEEQVVIEEGVDVEVVLGGAQEDVNGRIPVYRFWSDTFRGHFFTTSWTERDAIIHTYPTSVWRYEGVAFQAYDEGQPGTVPLFRFWSTTFGGHFYTTSVSERDYVIAAYPDEVWKYEGVAFGVYPGPGSASEPIAPVARFWSRDFRHHFYTSNPDEAQYVRDVYPDSTWMPEGDVFWVPAP